MSFWIVYGGISWARITFEAKSRVIVPNNCQYKNTTNISPYRKNNIINSNRICTAPLPFHRQHGHMFIYVPSYWKISMHYTTRSFSVRIKPIDRALASDRNRLHAVLRWCLHLLQLQIWLSQGCVIQQSQNLHFICNDMLPSLMPFILISLHYHQR